MCGYSFVEAFHELQRMEALGLVDDEDASLQMMLLYWGV